MTSTVKPSELPENAVISDWQWGRFYKDTGDVWIEMSPGRDMLPLHIWDRGQENPKNRPANWMADKSDDFFENFEILAVPQGWYPPYVEKEVVAWYDLANLRAIRKTTIHEIIEDDGTLAEEELSTAKASPPVWRDIPGHPGYETSLTTDGRDIYVRNKKTLAYRKRNTSGFFILFKKGKREWWCEGELGTTNQIRHFYKTGEVGADV